MAASSPFPLLFPLFLATSLCSCVLLSLVSAQPGFISLDCGGRYVDTRTDSNNISWTSDQASIGVGFAAEMQNPPKDLVLPLTSIRYFPPAGNVAKFCYMLRPLMTGSYYLVRATFAYGNYSGKLKQLPISFDLLLDATKWATVNLTVPEPPVSFEIYARARSEALSVCLQRSANGDPFISTLELRPLQSTMHSVNSISYPQQYLRLTHRVNYGARSNVPIRYPKDSYDRIWVADTTQPSIATEIPVDITGVDDQPPPEVLMTAIGVPGPRDNLSLTLNGVAGTNSYFCALYFSEIDQNVSREGERVFDVYLNGEMLYNSLDMFKAASDTPNIGMELYANVSSFEESLRFTLIPAGTSKLGPILGAIEILQVSELVESTQQDDINALADVKTSLKLNQWTGDPCLPSTYDWLECSSTTPPRITSLMLSHRNSSGSLSPSINSLTELTQISMDNSQLKGQIPDLSSLVNLQKLDLQNNFLTGTIPDSLATLPALKELLLQNNNLTGVIPANLFQKMANSALKFEYDGNPNLCIVKGCLERQKHNKTSIAIIVVCSLIGLAGICIAFYFVIKRRQKHEDSTNKEVAHNLWEEQKKASPIDAILMVKHFTYNEIVVATNSFTTQIGKGAFGPVFHGVLKDKTQVAVKVLARDSCQGVHEFYNEVLVLSRVRHKNLAALLGYCNEQEIMLVYEYMSKGTLRDRLYGHTNDFLTWRERLNIALDAAQGLEYLHSSCNPSIIHRDIKTSNILLNEKLQAKVADFGLSKLKHQEDMTHISTAIMGTPGYIDPEYYSTSQLTDKSDVYSFGVVLLEIISGRPPLDISTLESQGNILDWVRSHLRQGDIEKIVDPYLGRNYKVESLWKVVEVAIHSASFRRSDRPSISEVISELKEAKIIEMGNMGKDESSSSIGLELSQAILAPR